MLRTRARLIATVGSIGVLTGLAACGGGSPAGSASGPSATPAAAAPTATPTSVAASPVASGSPIVALDITSTISGFSGAVDAVATDHAVWVLDHSDSSLWPIDPVTNKLGKPVDVAAEGGASYLEQMDGLLWVGAQASGDLVAVDPVKGKVVHRVHVGGIDGGYVTAGDGLIWALPPGGGHAVGVDPKAGKIKTTIELPSNCGGTAAAGGGFLWVGSSSDGHLCKIDPATGKVVAELDGVGSPTTISWGGGRLWVPTDDGGVVVVDPAGPSIAKKFPAPAPGQYQGGNFGLGRPDENATIVADDTGAWVRYTHGIMGRVDFSQQPAWTLYAGLRGPFIGGETTAFDSIWIADTDQVLRATAPKL